MNINEFLIVPMRVFDRFWRNRLQAVERRIKIRHPYVPGSESDRCRQVIDPMHNSTAFDEVHCNEPRDRHYV